MAGKSIIATEVDAPADEWSVLLVCTANQARSPLAAAMFRQAASTLSSLPLLVTSAGTHAAAGRAVLPLTAVTAMEHGLDLEGHQSRALDPADVHRAHLVLAMTEAHRTAVTSIKPEWIRKTFTLRELVRLLSANPHTRGAPCARVTAAHRARPSAWPATGSEDIIDPVGRSLGTFREVARELDELTQIVASQLLA